GGARGVGGEGERGEGAEKAKKEEERNRSGTLAVELAGRCCREKKGERHPQARGEPGAVVQRQDERKNPGARRSGQMKQGGLVEKGLPGERWHDPRPSVKELVDNTESVRLVRFPRIVADQSRQQPGRTEQDDEQVALGHYWWLGSRHCDSAK